MKLSDKDWLEMDTNDLTVLNLGFKKMEKAMQDAVRAALRDHQATRTESEIQVPDCKQSKIRNG